MRRLKDMVMIGRSVLSQLATRGLSTKRASTVLLIVTVSALLAGCAGVPLPATVSEGTCKIIPRAEYEILGKTRNDQAWIDETIEGEVGGCGFERPQPRPPSWDVGPNNPPMATPPPAAQTRRPGIVKRTITKAKALIIRRKPVPGSVTPVPVPREPQPPPVVEQEPPPAPSWWQVPLPTSTPTPTQAPAPPPTPKPRNPVDELLNGT